jgi:hemerythrin-like metal-binding protein
MLTGVPTIDAEHQDLVAAINRLEQAEKAGDLQEVIVRLKSLRDDLALHFASEERYLRMVRFPASDEHAQHHAETLSAIDQLLGQVASSSVVSGTLAEECYHNFLSILLTRDMRFVNWLHDRAKKGLK